MRTFEVGDEKFMPAVAVQPSHWHNGAWGIFLALVGAAEGPLPILKVTSLHYFLAIKLNSKTNG